MDRYLVIIVDTEDSFFYLLDAAAWANFTAALEEGEDEAMAVEAAVSSYYSTLAKLFDAVRQHGYSLIDGAGGIGY